MSTYTSFALIGAGVIGKPILEALVAQNVSVVVLTRSASKELPAGAKSAVVDYSDKAAVVSVLKEHKVQVVVSTVGGAGILAQIPLADAAKEAGVQLFAPSEYGMPTEGKTEGFLVQKVQVADHLKAIGLPSALFYTGFFLESLSFVVASEETGKFHVVGKGETPFSLTAISDITGFVAYVLTTLPPSELSNAVFRLQGVRSTLLELAEYYKPLPVVHVDAIPEDVPLHGARTFLQACIGKGWASTGWDNATARDTVENAGSSNKLWKGHQWKGVKETLGL